MADFEFYVNSYLGSRIPEPEFPGWAARAEAALARFERMYHVTGGETARDMAICAMAEVLRHHARQGGVAAQSVGGVSVRYEASAQQRRERNRALYEQAATYLDIYRGVG